MKSSPPPPPTHLYTQSITMIPSQHGEIKDRVRTRVVMVVVVMQLNCLPTHAHKSSANRRWNHDSRGWHSCQAFVMVNQGNILVQCYLYMLLVLVLKEPFLCALDKTSENTLSCDMIWPANQSVMLLKQKQACGCSSALQATIELSDGRNDMVALSCKKNNKIIKCNSK